MSLSYGTLYPRGADLEDMITMVRAAVTIQENDAEANLMDFRKREWLVQAAALPATRWHGLYELAPRTDRIRSYYDPGRSHGIRVAKRHLPLLAAAFVDAPRLDPTMPMMLRVLRGYEDPRIDELALGVLEGLLTLDRPPWWTQDLLWAVLARAGDTEPETRLEEIGAKCWDVTPEQLRLIWLKAKGQLGIPDVSPAQIQLEEALPVGGRTPS